MPGNYGSDALYSNQQMSDFRDFAQSQGYGTSIAPEQCDLYDAVPINPAIAPFNTTPSTLTFYDQVAPTNVFQTVQNPVIRNGAQVPTQNLLGIYGVALEISWPVAPAAATDIEAVTQVYGDAVFEMFLAGDRQFMAKGAQLLQMLGNTPGTSAVTTGLGEVNGLASHVWPSTKLVMPGSTIRAQIQFAGANAAFAASSAHTLTLHVWAFNARR